MTDIICIGSVIRDIIFKTNTSEIPKDGCAGIERQPLICFRYGVKINPDKAFFLFGGAGANTAISFARLGLKASLFSKIGEDGTGEVILKTLKKNKVKTDLIQKDKKLHTALSFIIVGRYSERTIFPYAGASGNVILTQKEQKQIAKSKWIYLSTLRDRSQNLLPKILKIVSKNKIKLAFNPGSIELGKGYKYLKNILRYTEVLILNKEEAEQLIFSHKKIKNYDSKELLDELLSYGPKIVVITDGENGAWASNGENIFYIPCYKNKAIEQTGAGDAFGSGFVAGLIRFNDMKQALELANANSLSVISKFGAQDGLLRLVRAKRLINKFAKKYPIKELKQRLN